MAQVLLITIDGSKKQIDCDMGLESLQSLVGGTIEVTAVRGEPKKLAIVNEEGVLRDMPLNIEATKLLGDNWGYGIRGNVLIIDSKDFK